MRSAPGNYIVAAFVFVLFWLGFGFGLSFVIEQFLSLSTMTGQDWSLYYWVTTGIVALLGYGMTFLWLSEGSKEKMNRIEVLNKMPGTYSTYFFVTIILAVLLFGVKIFLFWGQGIGPEFYLLFLLIDIIIASVAYWLSTFLFTPKATMYCVWGKK